VVVNVVRHHQLVLSAPIIEEYRLVGARPKHRPYHKSMLTITNLLEQMASIVEPAEHSFGLSDPDDEIYLATAVAGGAKVLVTGNIRHFPARRYHVVDILTPGEFLTRHEPR
jgi:predicted nucleic acid-binding protein